MILDKDKCNEQISSLGGLSSFRLLYWRYISYNQYKLVDYSFRPSTIEEIYNDIISLISPTFGGYHKYHVWEFLIEIKNKTDTLLLFPDGKVYNNESFSEIESKVNYEILTCKCYKEIQNDTQRSN